jgi:glycosyltransferase involved in cell wall biosynthesis
LLKFSIITVVKNDKNHILKTINSVKKQTFKNFEYIIVDGKSNDGTSEIIKKNFQKNKKNKHIIKNDKNLYQALNYGINISKGKYIAILHSGDLFINKNTLKTISADIKDNDAVSSNILFKKENKIVRLWNYKIDNLNKFTAFKVAHTSLIIKRKIIKKIKKYNTKYNISSDTDFILRMSLIKNLKFSYIDKTFIVMQSGGISNSYKYFFNKISQDLQIYKKYFNKSFIFFYLFKLSYKLFKLICWKLFR